MVETLAIASAIASVVSAGASVVGGIQGKAAADSERKQYEEQSRLAAVSAAQQEAQRLKDLQRTLASQDALRAGRGVDLFSGTGDAIRTATIDDANDDISTIRLNASSAQSRYGFAAASADARGTQAMVGGITGAVTGLLSGSRAYRDLTK